ncbi:hypothetical protein BH24ACT15_BH24ACT15_17090 [soil metagenome]
MASDQVRESIVVTAPVGAVYDTVTSYELYPEWMEEFKEVEVLRRRRDGRADTVRYVLSAVGVTMGMTLAYTYGDSRVDWVLVDGDMITVNDGAYEMSANADGTTLLTYELMLETTVPLPGVVRRRFAKRTVNESLRSIKRRAET